MKKTVAIIYGGEGKERGVSKRSAEALFSLIDKEKYEALPIFISEVGGWFVPGKDPFGKLPTAAAKPTYPVRVLGKSGFLVGEKIIEADIAIPVLHGDFGEDGVIQGALDAAHIRYIGSGTVASAVCIDKYITKLVALSLGVPTARALLFKDESAEAALKAAEEKVGFPLFIKPTSLGSSIGASRVRTKEDFYRAYALARSYGRVLVEELLPVKYEVECAYFCDGEREIFCPLGIIDTNGEPYDFDKKYRTEGTARVSGTYPDCAGEIIDYSRRLCHAIGLRHIGRIDFLVTDSGGVYFNEINTIPGMTETSLYPRLTEGALGRDFINALLDAVLL